MVLAKQRSPRPGVECVALLPVPGRRQLAAGPVHSRADLAPEAVHEHAHRVVGLAGGRLHVHMAHVRDLVVVRGVDAVHVVGGDLVQVAAALEGASHGRVGHGALREHPEGQQLVGASQVRGLGVASNVGHVVRGAGGGSLTGIQQVVVQAVDGYHLLLELAVCAVGLNLVHRVASDTRHHCLQPAPDSMPIQCQIPFKFRNEQCPLKCQVARHEAVWLLRGVDGGQEHEEHREHAHRVDVAQPLHLLLGLQVRGGCGKIGHRQASGTPGGGMSGDGDLFELDPHAVVHRR